MSSSRSIRILLVDDHWSVLQAYKALIDGERPRMEVAGEARNSDEAVEKARSATPDVILLDKNIKDADGNFVDGLNLLPRLQEVSGARVLILTGEEEADLPTRAVERGARGVILKTESSETVLEAIESVHRGYYWLDMAATSKLLDRVSSRGETAEKDPEAAKIRSLTEAQRRVIRKVCEDPTLVIKDMAEQLNMSPKTLTNHLTEIYSALHIEEPDKKWKLFFYAKKHNLDKPE